MVIVVIGILATIGISQYGTVKEKAIDKEAIVSLKLIVAAEKIYRMETGDYFHPEDNADLNNNLKLSLPAGDNRNWDYRFVFNGQPPCAQATRHNQDKVWHLNAADEEPQEGICRAPD